MHYLTGWRRKLVLLFCSEKRLGARQLLAVYATKTFEQMRQTLITEADVDWAIYENKPRIRDLNRHFNKLKAEFIGQPELCFYHAMLIVLLRRNYQAVQTFAEFERLWQTQTDFLLAHLSLRWVISACDTFVDFSPTLSNQAVRAGILMNAVSLINTLKVYETQLLAIERQLGFDPKRLDFSQFSLAHDELAMGEGLDYFRVGRDDTLKNMRARYQQLAELDPLAGKILLHVFEAVQHTDSAFAFVKALHTDEKGGWWQEQVTPPTDVEQMQATDIKEPNHAISHQSANH